MSGRYTSLNQTIDLTSDEANDQDSDLAKRSSQ